MSRPTEATHTVRRQAKVEISDGLQRYFDAKEVERSAREHFDARFEDFGAFVAKLDRITKRSARVTR